MASHYIADCLSRRVVFFTGKGGVGKTTLAWATALACVRAGARVTLAGWEPFHHIQPPLPLPLPGLTWVALETLAAFREYVLQLVRFEKLYDKVFDNRVLRAFALSAPGFSETVVAGKIWDLVAKGEQDIVLVDLPASGHAASFFQSPLGIRKIFPVGFVHRESGKILDLLASKECRIDLVTLPEELSLTESKELKDRLAALHPFHFGFLHLNQCQPRFSLPTEEERRALPEALSQYVQRLSQQLAEEEEAEKGVSDWGLSVLCLPKIATPERPKAIEAVADTLLRVGTR